MNPIRSTYLILIGGLILSSFWYIGSALTAILLLTVSVTGYYSASNRREWRTYALTMLMLAYLAWLFIVALSSSVPNTSMMSLAVLAGLPVMYLVGSNITILDAVWPKLRTMLFAIGITLATWALWQVFYHIGYGQAVGPLTDRNAFAALMNLLWFPAAYLFLSKIKVSNRWISLSLGGGLFIISAALFATASRGGIATWMLLFPIILWAGYRHSQSKQLVAMIPLIAVLAYLFSTLFLHSSVADRTYQLSQDASTNARLLLWQAAIHMTLAHPFSGTGWGTFAGYYPAYRSPMENTTAGFFAHNDYLQLATEGGIPALLLQLSVMVGVILQLKHSLKRVADTATLESVALLLGTLALFIHASVNFIFYFAFMNIIAGLYLARAAQLTESPKKIALPSFNQISQPIKKLLVSFVVLLIAIPFVMHLLALTCLVGSQPGLKALNVISPSTSAYDMAKFITSIRPEEGIAQEFMLQTMENGLAESGGITMTGGNFQRELLNEAVERFDYVRTQTANNPNIGVREVKILLAYHDALPAQAAYKKAYEVLQANLKADPYHVNSMIALSRLQVAEGHRTDAIITLQNATHHILSRRDHQLLDVEILRQIAAPKAIPELDTIEKQLREVRSDSETGKPLILAPHFSEDIDARLNAIAAQLQPSH